jgi:hypothetical protein
MTQYLLLPRIQTLLRTDILSGREYSEINLCGIRGFHGGDFAECRLHGCGFVWVLLQPIFRRNLSHPCVGSKKSEFADSTENNFSLNLYGEGRICKQYQIEPRVLDQEGITM